jgi:hypothetical protein
MARPSGSPAALRLLVVCSTMMLATTACELLFMTRPPEPTPEAIFREAWTFADTHYSFFELKGIDWDAAYETYRPLVRPGMTERELFDLLAEMLSLLRDGHVNLRSPFDLSRYWDWYLGYPRNFDPELLERYYYQGNQEYAGPFVLYDFADDNAGYARYASFADTITSQHLDYLFTRFADRAGIVLDVRSNGGGAGGNAYRIGNRLVSRETVRGHQQYKSGPARNDFTPLHEVVLAPPSAGLRWEKPVVVLTNRSSYSATNLFVALVKGLDQVTVVGDTTGGGGGFPAFTELSNGWLMRVSAHRFYTADGLNVELGIDPDVRVDMEQADVDIGRDTILETALAIIRGP